MLDLDYRFQFLINKFENNTYYISQIIQNNRNQALFNDSYNVNNTLNDVVTTPSNVYDSSGAAKYIVVVVLVYGFSIIFFIGSQVRSTKKISDEVDEVNAEKILRSMETEIFTREVLGNY